MENKTEIRELSQTVQFSENDNTQMQQSASYDPADEWLCICHDGNEISLSRQNWEKLIHLGNRVISGTEYNFHYLKNLKQKDAAPILSKMTEIQLVDLLKQETDKNPLKYYRVRPFAQYILREIFKRSGLGYRQLQRLSTVQSKFVENMGISIR